MAITCPDQPEITAKVFQLMAERFGVQRDQITPDTTFEALGADSLEIVEAGMEVEQVFGVTMPDEALHTVGDVIRAVATCLTEQKA